MVFVVFDALTKQDAGNYECYKQALGMKAGDNVVKIISNPSYEFWILLHFSESAQSFTNNEKLIEKLNEKVRSELGKHFEYNKSGINKNLLNLMLKS